MLVVVDTLPITGPITGPIAGPVAGSVADRGGRRASAPGVRVLVRADQRGEVRAARGLEPAKAAVAALFPAPGEEHRHHEREHDAGAAHPHHRAADVHVTDRARRPRRTLFRQGRERVAALRAEDQPGERVHRHGDEEQEDPGRVGDPPPDRLPPDQGQEVQVARGQVEHVLTVVHGAVGLHQVHEAGQVRADDDAHVKRDSERRPGDSG